MSHRKSSTDLLAPLNPLRKKHGLSWKEFVHQLTLYPDIVEQALKLPSEITANMLVDTTTLHNLIPLWLDNVRENFATIKDGLDIMDIPENDGGALVIGAGPSLYRNHHLDMLADVGFDGLVFAADRVLVDCLEAGVIPDYVLILDGSEKILKYIDHSIVDEHPLAAIMCTTTHPSVVKRWGGEIYWFTNSISEDIAPNVAFFLHHLLKKTELCTAGHTSSVGWSVAHTMGCREIILAGVDLSFAHNTPIEETPYYDRYVNAGVSAEKIKSFYKAYHHVFFNTDCYYDPVFESYIKCSITQLSSAMKAGCNIINCTGGGAIEGTGIECAHLADIIV